MSHFKSSIESMYSTLIHNNNKNVAMYIYLYMYIYGAYVCTSIGFTMNNIRVCTTGRHTNIRQVHILVTHTNMHKMGESWITRTFAVGNLRIQNVRQTGAVSLWDTEAQVQPDHSTVSSWMHLVGNQQEIVIHSWFLYECSLTSKTLYHENSDTRDLWTRVNCQWPLTSMKACVLPRTSHVAEVLKTQDLHLIVRWLISNPATAKRSYYFESSLHT